MYVSRIVYYTRVISGTVHNYDVMVLEGVTKILHFRGDEFWKVTEQNGSRNCIIDVRSFTRSSGT